MVSERMYYRMKCVYLLPENWVVGGKWGSTEAMAWLHKIATHPTK